MEKSKIVDSMELIFDYQKKFGSNFRDYNNPNPEEMARLILCLYEEIGELQALIPWKPHRKNQVDGTFSSKLEGVVDIFKYIIEIALYLGISWEELKRAFYTKSSVCECRYKQEFLLEFDRVAMVDIDGVLTNYPQGFLSSIGYCSPVKSLKMIDLSNEIDMEYSKLREYKHHWRENGGYKKLETKHDFVPRDLKNSGYKVVMSSNRPFNQYRRIWGDTLEWLVEHNIPFDSLYFSEEKVDIFSQIQKSNIHLVVEDDPSQIQKYSNEGMTILVPRCSYNQDLLCEGVYFFSDRPEFLSILESLKS